MNKKIFIILGVAFFAFCSGFIAADEIHDLVRQNNARRLFILIDMGFADVNALEEGTGKTALDLAQERWASHADNNEILDVLKQYGAKRSNPDAPLPTVTPEQFWTNVVQNFNLYQHYATLNKPWLP